MAEVAMEIEYEPKEFFLMSIRDYRLVEWISDQTECLRSVFTVYTNDSHNIEETITLAKTEVKITRDNDGFDASTDDSLNKESYESTAQSLHLKDGSALIFICLNNGTLKGYHLCFEESPEEVFQTMIK
jgi:hypothetical protein